jgi:enamine deaminase RidA (YjgF/YER057c/UK114 family)
LTTAQGAARFAEDSGPCRKIAAAREIVKLQALKPPRFPWFDYSRYSFSLGLKADSYTILSGHSASEYDAQAGAIVVKGGMAQQTRTAWDKIATILEAGGQSLADVVRAVEYVTPAGIERYAEAAQARAEAFGANRPAVNTVVVKSLLRPPSADRDRSHRRAG